MGSYTYMLREMWSIFVAYFFLQEYTYVLYLISVPQISSNGAILSQDYQSGNSSSSWQFLPDNSLYVYYADPKMNSLCEDCMIYYRTNISTPDLNKINIIIQKKDPRFAATSDSVLVTTWYKTAFQDNLNEVNIDIYKLLLFMFCLLYIVSLYNTMFFYREIHSKLFLRQIKQPLMLS